MRVNVLCDIAGSGVANNVLNNNFRNLGIAAHGNERMPCIVWYMFAQVELLSYFSKMITIYGLTRRFK